jgi:hypothetical protein
MNAACIFKDNAKIVGSAVLKMSSQTWTTITCAKTASTVTLTVNGTARTITKSVGTISNSSALFIGGKGDGTDVLSGFMDYASITIG